MSHLPADEVRALFTDGCLRRHRIRPGQDLHTVRRAYGREFDQWLTDVERRARAEGRSEAVRTIGRDTWVAWLTDPPGDPLTP